MSRRSSYIVNRSGHSDHEAAEPETEPPPYDQHELYPPRQEQTDNQSPRRLGSQSEMSPSSATNLPIQSIVEYDEEPNASSFSRQGEIDAQLPSEHAQQHSSPSAASTTVVVDGRLNWRDTNAGPDITDANALDGAHEEADHEKDYPEKQTEVISNIITALYHEAQKNDPYKTPGCEACTDVVCQKLNCKNVFKTEHESKLLLSDTLRKGRTQGWNMLTKIIFPLLPDAARDVWVVGEILMAILGLALSITAVLLRPQEPFGVVHIIFIVLFSILALFDGIFTLKDCTVCKKCYNIYKGKYHSRREYVPYFKCCTKPCVTWCKNASDVTRVVATEITLYSLVVCDIFKVITGRRFVEGAPYADRLAIVLLVITSISFFLHVYVARVAIMVIAIKRILAIRSPNYKLIENYDLVRQRRYDFSSRKSAFRYLAYIFIHTILQMAIQFFIFFAIGGKMYNDNQNLFEDDIIDRSVHFSAYLWYLIGMGFITPIFGLFTSILVTYYWTQEFPIGLCLDIVSIWNLGGPEDFVHVKEQLRDDRQGTQISRVINQFLKVEEMRSEFKQFTTIKWYKKLIYSYTAPVVAISCLIYLILQAALIIYAGIAIREMGVQTEQLLNEGGWAYFHVAAIVIFAVLANAFSVSVAIFWILVALSSIMALLSTAMLLSLSGVLLIVVFLYKCCFQK